MKGIVWILAFLSCIGANAQSEDSAMMRKIADQVLSSPAAYENLRVLCKNVGARLAGSPGMLKAEAWGQKALEAAGADKVWLQECMVPNWNRGGKDEAWYSIKEGKNVKKTALDILALGNSMGTGAKGLLLPAILINDFNELEARQAEVKGKIVVFNNIFDPKNLNTFRSYMESGAYRRQGPSLAAKYGASAVLIRSITASTDNNPHTGGLLYDSAYPKIPAAAMGLKDADELIAQLRAGKEITIFYKSNAGFQPDAVGHNVIGELTGSEFPDRYITVGGHLDSWDPAEGAHDDGAGCVHSIEVLRALKAIGYKPRHTIKVVLFANEENGMRGGHKYADEARAKGEKHVFALESDAGGFTPRSFGFSLPKDKLRNIRAWVPLFEPYGVTQFADGGGGADIGPLRAALGTPIAGFNPDGARYFDLHHARNDVFENVNKRELDLGALNMALLIYMVDKYGL
ncbi:M20/M25/M40 family metallo-hydrolase [Flavihumibacter fluvii]|uniref:M20/M25/M40 family metallo-hydrolase n=1 Tax=Flavihumibacter fluvii TaxID=2838157 RepID=UPI001BDEB59A|nr:M20/M25/M40 family metallo-hydrolase [Flavihumibacter fluvii]ULQ51028.1 M20/M25/M40 family metallo-hydrolase [Flavihumibacter fluvii]